MDIQNSPLTEAENKELLTKVKNYVGDIAATTVEGVKIGKKIVSGTYNGAANTFTVSKVVNQLTEKFAEAGSKERTPEVVLYPDALNRALAENRVTKKSPKVFVYNGKQYLGIKAIMKVLG